MTMEELLGESEELFRQKNFSKLKWTSIKILELDSDNEKALTYLAYSYLPRDESDDTVLNIADKIHRLYPGNFHAYNLKAIIYLSQGNYKKALECCDEGLKIKDYYWLRINRIEALICLDRTDEAFEFYSLSEITNYSFTKALINCAKFTELPKYEPDLSKNEVMDYVFEKYRFIHNIWGFKEYFEKNEDDEIALTCRLYYLYNEDFCDYSEIYTLTDKIHRLFPDNYHAYNVEAMARLDNGEFKKAIECCKQGLKIKDYFPLKISMTEALICLERTDEAFEFYTSSQIPNYSFTEALIHCEKYSKISQYKENFTAEELVDLLLDKCRYLSNKSSHVIKGKKERIQRVCDEIFNLDCDNEVALGYKLISMNFHEQYKKALKCANHAIKLYPNNFRFYLLKAEILHLVCRNLDGAIENYEKAVSLESFNDNAAVCLIGALKDKTKECISLKNYTGAVECCEKILSFPKYKKTRLEALFTLEAIVKKQNLEYEPSRNYCETIKLNRKVYDCLTLDVGEYGAEYVGRCRQFRDYDSFADYLRDVFICLIELCPEADEKTIREKLKFELDSLLLSFKIKEAAYDAASEYVRDYLENKTFLKSGK